MRRARKKKGVDSEKAGDPGEVRATAITLLARRDFASGELSAKLAEQGYEASMIAQVVAELVEERAVDDARYAEHYVAYHAGRGQGPVRISADLKALGVDAQLIESALKAGPSWPAIAREVRIRKFGEETPDSWAEKGRQARFLQYRGFSSDHIRAALGPDFDPEA